MSKQTPLYIWHRSHGAKIAPFAGWDMPVQYHTGSIQEHHLVRRAVGAFDISHMGRIHCTGPEAADALQAVLTADIHALADGMSSYALLCREDGTIIDDVFVYRCENEYLVVGNASNHERDLGWFQRQTAGYSTTITDWTASRAGIALQGPHAARLLDSLCDGAASSLQRFGCRELSVHGVPMLVGRTGYTGEDGFELFPPSAHAEAVWDACFAVAANEQIDFGPCGLAARDSLRFEAGFHLYGHELDDTTNPVEARLKWACALGTEFTGRAAIESAMNNGTPRVLATFVLTEKAVPRQGYDVLDSCGHVIGVVTSGMFAPTVEEYAGNAYVMSEHAKPGTEIRIDVRGQQKAARVVKRPLYTPSYRG